MRVARRCAAANRRARARPREGAIANFMFATGIENSIPTINNGRTRVDQMDACGHYDPLAHRLRLRRGNRHQYLRYGPPLHTTFRAPGLHDWEFADVTLGDMKRRNITPILDLCHFGVPDWIGTSRTPISAALRDYAAAFAERYPWVSSTRRSTRCSSARSFSRKYGWWNEQATDDRSFVTALKHIVKANVLAMIEILKRRPDAIFVQSESSEYFHADSPAAIGPAEFMNARAS
jgi:hypothetical protein